MRNYLNRILIILILTTNTVWAVQSMDCTMDPNYRLSEGSAIPIYMEQVPDLPLSERISIENMDKKGSGILFIAKNRLHIQVIAKNKINNKHDIIKITLSDSADTYWRDIVIKNIDEIGLSPSNQLIKMKGLENFSFGGIPTQWGQYIWKMEFINDKWLVNLRSMQIPYKGHTYNHDFNNQLEKFSGRYTCKAWKDCTGNCSIS
ncbi:MAG: hypothetical protein K0R94_567 [Burkholderiales bacterium]|jgi:hypothetical protein|nr:hypothetical protein [Burkholderiales bacterium]